MRQTITLDDAYASIGEYGDHIAQVERDNVRSACAGRASAITTVSDFYGDIDLPRAIALAQSGGYWREAIADMQPLTIDQAALLQGTDLDVPTMTSNLQGFVPLIPQYLAGQPDCMLDLTPSSQPNKLLRIGVANVHSAGVSKQAIFNRGNAILSIVDALELIGFSCEICSVHSVNSYDSSAAKMTVSTMFVRVKASDAQWDPASVAFALCHAAFGRRLGFRWMESKEAFDPCTTGDGAYGSVTKLDPKQWTVTFDALLSNRGYASRRAGIDTLLDKTIKQIIASQAQTS